MARTPAQLRRLTAEKMLPDAAVPVLETLRDHNPLLFDFALKRLLRRRGRGFADAELRERIFSRIKAEWLLTRKHLLAILEHDDFLADNPMLKRSLQLRSPYMDPLNHLQVELLKRHRAGESDERMARAIHLSINGIASGLRNSG